MSYRSSRHTRHVEECAYASGHHVRRAPAPDASRKGPHGKPLPLAGTRIADFCIIIAGPTVGRVLADLGADVIKIEAPNRELSPYLWFDVNRGKRSILLDLKKPEAVDVARRIIDRADVVSENFRSGKFAAFGFGYDALVKDRPELICASTNALDYDGPWETRAGWEHNAQAGSGQQAHEFNLRLRGDIHRLVLQSVAWRHVGDDQEIRIHGGLLRR